MTEHKGEGKFFFGLFLGGLVGAIMVFFLGTPEGKKAGKALKKKGEALLSDLEVKVEEFQSKGKDLIAHGEELKDDLKVRLMDKKEELTNEAVTRIDKTLENIETLQQKGLETTENLRKQFKNPPKKTTVS